MFYSSKKSTNEFPQSSVLDNLEKGYPKLPSLLMTPIFTKNSTWPSYLINPLYDENDVDKKIDNHYYDTINNLANNITSQGHTTHVTQNGTQMFPTMPYYLQGTKIGSETVHPTIYQHQGVSYNNQNVNVPIVPTTPQMVTNEDYRKYQLWYYKQYQPTVYDNVV
tara:strand:- start:262 stop:756 length:495 start_codon:yes stop_codon:yes gene_type:complete